MLYTVKFAALTLAVALPLGAGLAAAQQAGAAAPPAPTGPAVNDVAPDFALAGADRYGLLKTPVRLSDYRGRTVVLAFFYQARTKG
jgi:cytochrome oxidase Cu insertion factor (SCO1/SenC/PrrC family)